VTLSKLIRKGGLARVATATPATLATQEAASAASVAEVATVAVAKPPTLSSESERVIRAWLAHIEETDEDTIAEVLSRCRADTEARGYFLRQAEEVPAPHDSDYWVRCEECQHFRRIDHPHLGHCASGEPEAIVGLWDTDRRWCESYVQASRLHTVDSRSNDSQQYGFV